MNMMEMIREKKILLVSHRGVCGGNIPCNSLQAFQAAINMGADMIELDVENSIDGELYLQHPGMEKVHLRMQDSITKFPAAVVDNFKLSNCDLTPTEWPIAKLEDAFKLLKGKCMINIDKFWNNPKGIAELIRKYDMADQILIKTENKKEYLDAVEEYAPDIPYMTIAREVDDTFDDIMRRNINYVGNEVLFKTEDSPFATKEYVDMMHANGKIVWVNGLVYNYKDVLAAYHNDDVSMYDDPEKGWGWLADRGYDLIQTDFLLPCRLFLEATGRRNK